jgi:hypothetical protein
LIAEGIRKHPLNIKIQAIYFHENNNSSIEEFISICGDGAMERLNFGGRRLLSKFYSSEKAKRLHSERTC